MIKVTKGEVIPALKSVRNIGWLKYEEALDNEADMAPYIKMINNIESALGMDMSVPIHQRFTRWGKEYYLMVNRIRAMSFALSA